jgi:hypothetical protein
MTITLPDIKALNELIAPDKIAAQGFLRPSKAVLVDSSDHDGDPSFQVYLVYPNKTKEPELAWSKQKHIVHWVREVIRASYGEDRWVYVDVMRSSEAPKVFV